MEVHIVGIPGSLTAESATRQAVQVALEGAAARGAITTLVDLRDFSLPFEGADAEGPGGDRGAGGNGAGGDAPGDAPGDATSDVARLQEAVRQADGIVLGTPEYHGGYSGVLKNALDLMGFPEFEGKMVGLVAVSGGALGGAGPLSGLRSVCRALHAWVVPNECTIPRARRAFAAGLDERTRQRLHGVGAQVAKFAALHRSDEAQAFLREWERAYDNPGA